MLSKFFLNLIIFAIIIAFIPKNSNANIYELSCKNNKNTTTWVYSNKRQQVILTKINNSKTKVNFKMDRQTPSSFSSKGSIGGFQTNVTFSKNSKELAMLQKSLRGSNQFYKCSEPKLLKEE
ncbi:hypothetical protein OAR82_01575 [Candidatus Pelagibacter sp.]|nr:hypothetical protein [Candidatus Pelagibacter sp.]